MVFSLIGLGIMWFNYRKLALPIVIYFILSLYLISSWWDWGYGGSFGMRALVQSYAFLAFPLAYFLKWIAQVFKAMIGKIIMVSCITPIFGFLIYLNMYQTYQMNCSLLHWDSMTKEAYQYTFLTTDVNRVYLETLFKHPNYEEMRKGNRDE
jgi:hypothetical protein